MDRFRGTVCIPEETPTKIYQLTKTKGGEGTVVLNNVKKTADLLMRDIPNSSDANNTGDTSNASSASGGNASNASNASK